MSREGERPEAAPAHADPGRLPASEFNLDRGSELSVSVLPSELPSSLLCRYHWQHSVSWKRPCQRRRTWLSFRTHRLGEKHPFSLPRRFIPTLSWNDALLLRQGHEHVCALQSRRRVPLHDRRGRRSPCLLSSPVSGDSVRSGLGG